MRTWWHSWKRCDASGSAGKPADPRSVSAVSVDLHPERGRKTRSDAGRFAAAGQVSFSPSPIRRFHTGISKCLRRILPSAWSARQRTLSPIRHVSKFAPPRTTNGWRGRSGVVCPSRTGSSWSVIRVCGTSAFADPSTNSSAIARSRDDGRKQEFRNPRRVTGGGFLFLPRTRVAGASIVQPRPSWRAFAMARLRKAVATSRSPWTSQRTPRLWQLRCSLVRYERRRSARSMLPSMSSSRPMR